MGFVIALAFLGYGAVVCVPAAVGLVYAGVKRLGIPEEQAPKGPRRVASIGAFAVAIVVHAGVQIAGPVLEGSYYPFAWAVAAWFGIPTLLVAIPALVCIVLGRRRKDPVTLAVGQGLCAALLVFTVIAIPEAVLLDSLGVRTTY